MQELHYHPVQQVYINGLYLVYRVLSACERKERGGEGRGKKKERYREED